MHSAVYGMEVIYRSVQLVPDTKISKYLPANFWIEALGGKEIPEFISCSLLY